MCPYTPLLLVYYSLAISPASPLLGFSRNALLVGYESFTPSQHLARRMSSRIPQIPQSPVSLDPYGPDTSEAQA
ncbi:hypothetical protein C8F04DRAFT_190927 [Mycena alexandri]|uniref:Uncharacterized protein n=1 Tax=Mycena alexandri TaxID=1745969 RepID=A0AAD6S8L9_9AGAR|nr:hypothetical protein C8F04DRAFT_190927 [Mycena alexandri]